MVSSKDLGAAQAGGVFLLQGSEEMPRGTPKNLIVNSELTPSERKKKASVAGKKSGEVRRKAKSLREALQAMLDGKYEVDGKTLEGRDTLALALIRKAASGDVSAFNSIRDTIGEKPKEKAEVDATVKVVMDKSVERYSK